MFSEMRRILNPGGRIVVADVAEDSFVRGFLDDFVGNYCATGHSGWYFGATTRSELHEAGLNIVDDKWLDYSWCAPNIDQLAEFCKLLFGMVQLTPALLPRGFANTWVYAKQVIRSP